MFGIDEQHELIGAFFVDLQADEAVPDLIEGIPKRKNFIFRFTVAFMRYRIADRSNGILEEAARYLLVKIYLSYSHVFMRRVTYCEGGLFGNSLRSDT